MLWRVWKTDGRYKLVEAASQERALRKVKHSTSASPAYDRKHPSGTAA